MAMRIRWRWASLSASMVLAAGAALGAPPLGLPDPDEGGCDAREHPCAHAKRLALRLARHESPVGDALDDANAAASTTDLLHYNLDIEINPAAKTIAGSNTLTVRSLVDGMGTFRFRLQNNYNITGVKIGATNLSYSRVDSIYVDATLDRAYNTGEQFDLCVQYNGLPLNNGFDSITFTTRPSGAVVVSTLSETDFAYTWWPTKDDNRDKATADLRFTVPSTMSVASNGLLQSTTDLGNGKSTWFWQTSYPIATYLICFSVTNYNRFSSSYTYPAAGGGTAVMPLEYFIYPEADTPTLRNVWLLAPTMMEAYRPYYGLYPFVNEKYGIYNFEFGGGMEHQTMTGQVASASESLTSHELSHQWWGDNVTCATWNDIWLNEGFATYTEALWLEKKPGSTGTPALISAMAARRPSSVNGSVYIPEPLNTADINRIFSTSFSYRKPAWALHMLRHIVGDTTFFNILAAYRGAYQGGSATTADFQAIAESVYGQSLFWFFDEWIYKLGAPAYQTAWRALGVGGQNYVELYVKQVQSASYPIFKMPVDVRTTILGVNTTNIVWNDAAAEHLLFPVTGAVTALAFDPTPYILATSNTATTFVEGPPKVVGVSPAPGTSALASAIPSVAFTFHKNVTSSAADFTLVGPSGSVPFSHSYNSSVFTVTLTPLSSLAPGVYTLTALDSVRDVAAAKQLDGEIAGPTNPAALPSGDGLPGGAAVVSFTVQAPPPPPPCAGDANGDNVIDFADVTSVFTNWGAPYAPGGTGPGDANHDGAVDFADATGVFANWASVCP